MTNPMTDSKACSACSPRAQDAVHHFAMPGLGFRSVHRLLGIFRKNYEEVPRELPGTFLPRARHFSENVRASVQFAERHAPQGTLANGQGLGTRDSVRGRQRSRSDLPSTTCRSAWPHRRT